MPSPRFLSSTLLLLAISGAAMAQPAARALPAGLSCDPNPLRCLPDQNATGAACRSLSTAVYMGCMAGQDPFTALSNALQTASGTFPQCVSSTDPNVSSFNASAPYAQYTDPQQNPQSQQTTTLDGTAATQNGFTVKGQAMVCLNPAYGLQNPTTKQSATPAMIFVCAASGVTPGSTSTAVNVHVDCGPPYVATGPNKDSRFPTPGYGFGNTHAVTYGLMAGRPVLNVNYSGITSGSSVFSGFQMDLTKMHPTPQVGPIGLN